MSRVEVVEYDPRWPEFFQELRSRIAPALQETAISIEHVGSTSVPGLCAKPVIDISIVVVSDEVMPLAIERLASIGYAHRGDLGVEGREAFAAPDGFVKHHLYACPQGSLGLRNHLVVRDALRADRRLAAEYGELKRELASRFPNDIDSYIDGKTGFLLSILSRAEFECPELDAVDRANRKPSAPHRLDDNRPPLSQ